MKAKRHRRRSVDTQATLPRRRAVKDVGPGEQSPTAVAAEALRTGVLPVRNARRLPPGEDLMRVGDPDDNVLENEYVGEDTPGGSTPTPDQNGVDEIGRAYGLQEEDSGALRSGAEVLERRDRHRVELQPPAKPGA